MLRADKKTVTRYSTRSVSSKQSITARECRVFTSFSYPLARPVRPRTTKSL